MMSRDEKTTPPVPLRSSPEPATVHDPSAQWALSLLSEAEPYQEVPGRRGRVWLGLQSKRLRSPFRPGRFRWRFALAALALTTGAAFASAAVVGWPAWLARAIGRTSSVPAVEPRPVDRPAVDRAATAVEPPTVAPPAPSLAPVVPTPSLGNPLPPPAHPRRHATANTTATATEDTGPLLQAMRALRIEHNPVRARQLLTDYLGQHPRGFLAEEALVMLVEAAAAHHDSDAAALVARYHRLYPEGAFRGQVERISAAYDKKP